MLRKLFNLFERATGAFADPRLVPRLIAAAIASTLLLALFSWPIYRRILTPADAALGWREIAVILSVIWITTFAAILPALAVAAILNFFNRPRAARCLGPLIAHTLLWIIVIDLCLVRDYGRHLSTFATLALQPDAMQFTGGVGPWITLPIKADLGVVALLIVSAAATRFLVRKFPQLAQLPAHPRRRALIGALAIALTLTPVALTNALGQAVTLERTLAVLPLSPPAHPEVFAARDPILREVNARIVELPRIDFASLSKPGPTDRSATFDGRSKPNVIWIAIESFNREQLDLGAMPKLQRWGSRGMYLARHYSGGNRSEAGIFSLLYARSPIVYAATLDRHQPPQACVSFTGSGYRTAWASGVNPQWLRMDEFVNAGNFRTAFEFYEPGNDIPNADRHVLQTLRDLANETGKPPLFAMTFLDAPHFPYHAPANYDAMQFALPPHTASLPWNAQSRDYYNRYRRSLAFMDDVIDEFITSLDPGRNIIVVTGDHGEGVYPDGNFTHAANFSDAQARVPMFIVGPGVPRLRLDTATSHTDLLPTILHLAAGHHVPVANCTGRDLLDGVPKDEVIVGVPNHDGKLLMAAIRGNSRLAFIADPRSSELRAVSFEDRDARLILDHHETSADTAAWADFMGRQLRSLRTDPSTPAATADAER